ncbi:MAG TPA: anti-sigma factor [Gaiellaceae bacterium]|nr:anti-sigma factor [Gaiellaceae bacterium]
MPLRGRQRDDADGRELAELAALADGSLPADRRRALEEEVAASPELADRLAEQQRAVALAQSAAVEVKAPDDLRRRIESGGRARPARSPRRVLLAGAAAAAVAAAVAIGLVVSRPSTSGEQFRAALAATPAAPGASGAATLTRTSSGWRIELDASGLPRLDGGRFYEAWLRSKAGVLVPIGTFNEARRVTLWAGVSPQEFPALTVTREQANGDQASSGRKVLVGTAEPSG